MKRVVVTSLGAISPVGSTAEENWQSIVNSKSGISTITIFDISQYACKIAGEVKNYSPEKYFHVRDIKRMDRFIQFSMVAGTECLEKAKLDLSKENLERIGVYMGVGIGGLIEIQANYKVALEKGPKRISPFFIPMAISNLAAGHLSLKYGLKGPNLCITSACSSSSHAIGESFRLIQRGEVDMMLSGGAESAVCELGIGGFCAMRAMSEKNDQPTKASRPFDKDRDGFVMGEGAAVILLEELEHAKKRGATILAEVVGYGSNSDAFHITQPSENGEGAARCMKLAIEDAKISPDKIDYINAHGTSTPIGDIIETQAIKTVFGDHAYKLAVSSTKSMTGHLLGAAGALEAMFSIQAMNENIAPPTINLDNPSPECDLNYVPNEAQSKNINYALSNSFGFGGTNGTLIFKKYS
jgi:3-oxoacyl-[acyl-carrier-protein] synthase II